MPLNQVALATDGASSMTGHRMEQAARRCAKVSILMNVHYIAHREALHARDATRVFLEFQMLNCFGNKVHEWMGRSTNRRNELKRLLKDVFEEDYVAVLQIHAIYWFSQGNVMTHLPQCMPTVFKLLRNNEPYWYEIIFFFKFPFLLELVCRFFTRIQYDMVDVTTISAIVDITTPILPFHF